MSKRNDITWWYYRMIILASLCVFLLFTTYWTVKEYRIYTKNKKNISALFIQEENKELEILLNNYVQLASISKSIHEDAFNNSIREQTYEAFNFILSLKSNYSNSKLEELLPFYFKHFNSRNSKSPYSIFDLNGRLIYTTVNNGNLPENLLNYRDDKGSYPYKQIINFINDNNEGFFEFRQLSETQNKYIFVSKRSYLLYIKELNWIIESGSSISNFENLVKSEIFEKLFTLNSKSHYELSITDLDGNIIPVQNLSLKARTGFKQSKSIALNEIEKEKLGSSEIQFVNYTLENTENESKVISALSSIEDLNLALCLRYFYNDSYIDLNENVQALKEESVKRVSELLLSIIIIIVIFIMVSMAFRNILQKEFSLFKSILKTAIINKQSVIISDLKFNEFKQLALATNGIFKSAKLVRKELVQSEERFRTIIENSPVLIMAIDKKNKFYIWNKECEKKLQYDINELNKHPRPFTLFFSVEYAKLIRSHLEKADGKFRLYKLELRDKTDSYQKWAHFRLKTGEVISVGYDVTELIEKEKLLIENKTFLQELLNNIPSPIFYKNNKLQFEGCNINFCELIGKTESEIIGKTSYDIFAKSEADTHQRMDEKLMETYEVQVYEEQTEFDTIKHFLITKSVYYDQNGEIAGLIGIMQDITKRKVTEKELLVSKQELSETNITKDKLFTILSHDLKNPLNAILSLSKALYKKAGSINVEEYQKYFHSLNMSSEKTLQLLDNLLNWSVSQAGKLEPKLQEVNVPQVINESISYVLESANEKSIKILNKIYEDFKVFVDYNMISSVFRNIIYNAIKFTPENGKIVIEAKFSHSFIEVSIEDSGIGMDQNTLNNIFNVNHLVQSEGTNNETGTGIGLFLSKELVEINKGIINVKSELGKGSIFKIALPYIK